jgi:hypothetical protein
MFVSHTYMYVSCTYVCTYVVSICMYFFAHTFRYISSYLTKIRARYVQTGSLMLRELLPWVVGGRKRRDAGPGATPAPAPYPCAPSSALGDTGRQRAGLVATASSCARAARASKREVSRSSWATKVRPPGVSRPEDSPGLLGGVNRRHARAADMPHAIIELNKSFEGMILP